MSKKGSIASTMELKGSHIQHYYDAYLTDFDVDTFDTLDISFSEEEYWEHTLVPVSPLYWDLYHSGWRGMFGESILRWDTVPFVWEFDGGSFRINDKGTVDEFEGAFNTVNILFTDIDTYFAEGEHMHSDKTLAEGFDVKGPNAVSGMSNDNPSAELLDSSILAVFYIDGVFNELTSKFTEETGYFGEKKYLFNNDSSTSSVWTERKVA